MRVKFSDRQFDKIADLFIGLGQLFFGSTVLPYVIPNLDRPPYTVLLFGVGFALSFWIFAIWVLRK